MAQDGGEWPASRFGLCNLGCRPPGIHRMEAGWALEPVCTVSIRVGQPLGELLAAWLRVTRGQQLCLFVSSPFLWSRYLEQQFKITACQNDEFFFSPPHTHTLLKRVHSFISFKLLWSQLESTAVCLKHCGLFKALQFVSNTAACLKHCSLFQALQPFSATVVCLKHCSLFQALWSVSSTVVCFKHCSLFKALQPVSGAAVCLKHCSVFKALQSV